MSDVESLAAGVGAQAIGPASVDLSVLGMFFAADWVVKLIILLLLALSVVTWSIAIDRYRALRRIGREARAFEKIFWTNGSLDDLYKRLRSRPPEGMASIFAAGMREREASAHGGGIGASLLERMSRAMDSAISRQLRPVERLIPILATIGSTAPFIGLFGTVWGVMNAFKSIAISQSSSLSVVAPGIAEALFVTAIGLFAAVPATVAYNRLNTAAASLREELEEFADDFLTLVQRHLEASEQDHDR